MAAAAAAAPAKVATVSDFYGALSNDGVVFWDDMMEKHAPNVPRWNAGAEDAIVILAFQNLLTQISPEEANQRDNRVTAEALATMEKEHPGIRGDVSKTEVRINTRLRDIADDRERFYMAVRRYLMEWLRDHASEMSRADVIALYNFAYNWTENSGWKRTTSKKRMNQQHALHYWAKNSGEQRKRAAKALAVATPALVLEPPIIPEPEEEKYEPVDPPAAIELVSPGLLDGGSVVVMEEGNWRRSDQNPLDDMVLAATYYEHVSPVFGAMPELVSPMASPVREPSQSGDLFLADSSQRPRDEFDEAMENFQMDVSGLPDTYLGGAAPIKRGLSLLDELREQDRKRAKIADGTAVGTSAKGGVATTTGPVVVVCARGVCTRECVEPRVVCHRCLDRLHAVYCSQECCEADASDHADLCELERSMAQVRV